MDADRHDRFMSLFLENEARIRAYIRSLVPHRADADDVLQETASVLWRKFDDFETGTHFDRWAYRTAYFQVRAYRQRRSRDRLQFDDEVLERIAENATEFTDGLEETHATLQSCVRKLQPEDQQLLALRYQEDATNRSVARRVGKSESVISRSLNRIYSSLFDCLDRNLGTA